MEKQKFQQRAKVGVAGSFFNQLMSNNASVPEVGKGATIMYYTDRSVAEVIEVSEDGKTVKLESLNAKIDPVYLASMKGKDVTGHQNWVYEKTGRFFTIVWKYNAWRIKNREVVFTDEFIKKAQEATGKEYPLHDYLTEQQRELIYKNDIRPQTVVEGITKERFRYDKINILFGRKDYYYDWSF